MTLGKKFFEFIARSLNLCRRARAAKKNILPRLLRKSHSGKRQMFCRSFLQTETVAMNSEKYFAKRFFNGEPQWRQIFTEFSRLSPKLFRSPKFVFFVTIRNISPKISFFLDKSLAFCYININDNVIKFKSEKILTAKRSEENEPKSI